WMVDIGTFTTVLPAPPPKRRRTSGTGSLWLHREISLNLLVERRTEVGAVKGVDARLPRLELHGSRLSRINDDVHVVLDDAEPVNHVGRLFHVGHMDGHLVAGVHVDAIGNEPAPNRDHLDLDLVAAGRDAGLGG